MKLETVHETFDPVEADVLRGLLEEAGIRCAEMNEAGAATFGPTPDTALRLMVDQDQAERARGLIREYLANPPA